MHLKRQGAYLCRTLSFEGCVFHTVSDSISEEQIQIYDAAARMWQQLLVDLIQGIESGSLQFPLKKRVKDLNNDDDDDDDVVESDDDEDDDIGNKDALRVPEDKRAARMMILRYFWGAHQVIMYLIYQLLIDLLIP